MVLRRWQGGRQRSLVVAALTQRGAALQHRKESRLQATLRPKWPSVGGRAIAVVVVASVGQCRSVVWLWFALLSCSALSCALLARSLAFGGDGGTKHAILAGNCQCCR